MRMSLLRRSRLLAPRGNPLFKPIDRAGIALVMALGVLPRRKRPATLRRIGVLRSAAIGDTFHVNGLLQDIRAAHPEADLVLVTGRGNAEAGALSVHGLGRQLVLPLSNPVKAIGALRRERFDALIDTGSWPRFDALLTALSGARFRVGFRTPGQHRHYTFDAPVDRRSDVHEIENYRALGRAVGTHESSQPRILRDALPAVTDMPDAPFAVFHPWAGGYRGEVREWPVDRWVTLATRLQDQFRTVLVTGAPNQADRTSDLVAQLRAKGISASGSTHGVRDAAAIIASAQFLVGVNTGIPHLSALLGTPSVVLDGPTRPQRWGLIGPRTASVVSSYPDCGYLELGYDYAGNRQDCMRGISVDEVDKAVRRLLQM